MDTLHCSYFPARRPPVEETASFLQSLLNSHGTNFLEILFGPRARNNMKKLGGIQNVAIVLSGCEADGGVMRVNSLFRVLHDWWLCSGSEAHLHWSSQSQTDISQRRAGRSGRPLGYWSQGEDSFTLTSLLDLLFMFIVLYPSQDSELGDMKFFIDKLIRTGFLDTVWNDIFKIVSNKICLLSILVNVKPTFISFMIIWWYLYSIIKISVIFLSWSSVSVCWRLQRIINKIKKKQSTVWILMVVLNVVNLLTKYFLKLKQMRLSTRRWII